MAVTVASRLSGTYHLYLTKAPGPYASGCGHQNRWPWGKAVFPGVSMRQLAPPACPHIPGATAL